MQLVLNGDTRPIIFPLISSSDHITGLTGASPTVTISKNGAGFAAPAGSAAEIGNGWYKLTPSGSDVTTNGPLILHATATGADPSDVACQVVAFSPYDSVRLGLSALPNAASGASGGLPTGNASGQVTVGGYASGEDPATLVWSALTASFDTANTFGAFVQSISGGGFTLDSSLSGHTTAGTVGLALNNILTAPPTAATVAASVWNAATASFDSSGSFGAFVQSLSGGGGGGLTVAQILSASLAGYSTAGTVGQALNNLDAAVSSRVATSSLPGHFSTLAIDGSGFVTYNNAAPPAAATVAGAVWDVATAAHAATGSFGALVEGLSTSSSCPTVAQIAAGILANPAHLILTDSSGFVTYNNAAPPGTAAIAAAVGAPSLSAIAGAVLADPTYPILTNASGQVQFSNAAPPTLSAIESGVAAAILATPSQPIATDSSGNVSLSSATLTALENAITETAIASGVLDQTNGIETGLTVRQAIRVMVAAAAGALTGAGTGTVVIDGAGVGTTRITATVDVNGNRSAVTLNP